MEALHEHSTVLPSPILHLSDRKLGLPDRVYGRAANPLSHPGNQESGNNCEE
jgi:hypothetical protein